MATQMVSQAGGSSLFGNNGNFGISLDGAMYGLPDLSKAEIAAPQLIMLANVALTGEVSSSCCDYIMDEERQMAELTTVNDNSFSDGEGERMEESHDTDNASELFNLITVEPSETQTVSGFGDAPDPQSEYYSSDAEKQVETPAVTDKNKSLKSKPFRCKPCQYWAENEEAFVLHIKSHSAKPFIDSEMPTTPETKDSESYLTEEGEFSKGPIRCDRCGYNTNRFDHYLAHLKHHEKVGENERVYKCTICTYTTVSVYHWKKHLRNHFPRIVYSCSQCSYFSDRKNNYIQHIRTHTGERPYQCVVCPYSSSQKTHLTRHMRTHSGEKPFKCEQCSYVASNQHEVTRHARQVHNGPKPLTCPHCMYKTADRSNFKKHVELHVNPRQFMCPVCDYAASKKCNLQYHIKSRHSSCADLTMDVSKVKLRTKKMEVEVMDSTIGIRNDNENAEVNDLEGKKPVESVNEEKKNITKLKKHFPEPVNGQVAKSSRRSSSLLKPGDESNVEISTKPKCGKRKVRSEDKLKANDAQTTTMKKKKLVQKHKSSEMVKKKMKTETSHKLKGSKKKNKENKLALKKKNGKQRNRKTVKTKKSSPKETMEDENSVEIEARVNASDCPEAPDSYVQENPEINAVTPTADPPEGHAESGTEEETLNLSTTPEHADLPLPSENSANMSTDLPTENTDSAEVDVNPSTILLGPEGKLQMETTDIHISTVMVQTDESTEGGYCQDKQDVLESNAHELSSKMDCSASELHNTSEGARGVFREEEQEHDESKQNGDLETIVDLEQNMTENECHLDRTEASGEHFSENNGTLELGEKLEGDDKLQNTFTTPVNKELEEQEKSEETVSLQGYEKIEDQSKNPGNLEMNMESNGLDTPKNTSEINEKSLEKVDAVETPDLLSECCARNLKNCEPKDIQTSAAPCKVSGNPTLDPEEDEGIHSHDGSDISDNVSERSDDSGLNGVPSVQKALADKPGVERTCTERNNSKENFVCIFCDRSFKKEEEYTKHLKRHLVNVYYLEKAAQGQV